ncbi:Fe-S cluster assembly protein SufD [Cerasicoccus arenae]|uniref:Fe-S cluster assembly protein SufD n=1 Tax=Cerasicoccus arenae TaxID=424488 RepID=A0A8J3GDS3_9BACT|nr:Fe-S cluster assembly protein SufD [Cerasicoccus arenae]MBK1858958.1 Fe-S cluster assembly protein SufD [Cerasicoccus arenae]GHC04089.1 Fe-S cluster assembly protein SufD [Cerasicoccus arenae]
MSLVTTPVNEKFSDENFRHHLDAFWLNVPWVQELKENSWREYQELRPPVRTDEHWRFTDLRKLKLEGFSPSQEPEEAQKAAVLEQSNVVGSPAGRLVFGDNFLIDFDGVSGELAAKGVIWMPLSQAVVEHPELVQKYFLNEENRLGSEKLLALHNAFFHGGSFLYVPKGVEIEQPLCAYYWSIGCNEAIFPHTLLVVEDNAKVDFVDYYGSYGDDCCSTLSCGVGTIYAGQGAQVFRKIVQNFNEETLSFQLEANIASRDSSVKTIAVNLGSAYARLQNHTRIVGPGADVKMYGLTIAKGEQEFDQRTLQIHEAPHAVSDLLFKNVLLDDSRTIFSGLIKVDKDAQQTDAYQTNRNLLLSKSAEANSLPGLEIEANDVKCSHGATTGQVDENELFYLMARGIPRATAYELLVYGFFEEIVEKISNEDLRENVRLLVRKKFAQ